MSMPRDLQIRCEFQCVLGSILDHFRCKICTFLGIKSLRPDVAKQEAKIDRKWGRERQKTTSSWSIFRAKMGMGLGAKIWRFSETILEPTKIDLDVIFGVKIGSQDRSPECVFQGSNLETRLLKKMHPSQAKTIFLHVDEVWKCVDLGFQNRSKIVTFSTSILEAIFVDFWSENEGFGGPSWRPNFSKNRSQDGSLEVLKNVSLKLSSASLDA